MVGAGHACILHWGLGALVCLPGGGDTGCCTGWRYFRRAESILQCKRSNFLYYVELDRAILRQYAASTVKEQSTPYTKTLSSTK